MANNQENLIGHGFNERTAEEQRKIASMGGKSSGEARRRKRDIRLAMEALLEKQYKGRDGTSLSGAEAIAMKQMEKALKGDPKAFELVRDTAGQKPVEKVEQVNIDAEYKRSVEIVREVMEKDDD